MRWESINAIGWACVVETYCDNGVTIRTLIDQHERTIDEPEEMCKVFQEHFAQLFERGGGMERSMDFTDFLASVPHLSEWGVECCEGVITAAKMEKVLSDYGRTGRQDLIFPTSSISERQTHFGTCWHVPTPTDCRWWRRWPQAKGIK